MAKKEPFCKSCQIIGHYAISCRTTARTAVKTRKRPNQVGPITRQWIETRKQWFLDHPQESYSCSLRISPFCPGRMRKENTALDHIIARSRRPDLRFDMANLQPSCHPCNSLKGSREL